MSGLARLTDLARPAELARSQCSHFEKIEFARACGEIGSFSVPLPC